MGINPTAVTCFIHNWPRFISERQADLVHSQFAQTLEIHPAASEGLSAACFDFDGRMF